MCDPSCDVVFRDLCFEVSSVLGKEKKQVLKSVSGVFKSCELTAIVGTSGCGKTSLLNILSGYTTKNVSGDIEIQNVKRSYIMQMENLHTLFTIQESVMFSINVRNGFRMPMDEKLLKVQEVLESLGLESHKNTLVKNLSGGQLKRLSIAQELVDDPSVIFLDEPTTGLDSASAKLCIQLLKKLALSGKTIVCTIHSPSGLWLSQFDHMYGMTDGRCIYQGSSQNLVQFLSECGLTCPESYNPCDFLSEIANGEYGEKNDDLCDGIKNGKEEKFRKTKDSSVICESFRENPSKSRKSYSNFLDQLWFLMIRNSLIIYRDLSNMWLRLGIHILCSLFVSLVFANVGNDGSKAISNIKLIYGFSTFVLYTNYYSMATRFPMEKSVIKREHFNKWYSSEAYYIALTVTDVPIVISCLTVAVLIAWDITGQPLELFRFQMLMASQTLLGFTSQGFGLMVGSCFNLKRSQLTSAALVPITVLFGGFLISQKDSNRFFHWFFDVNFVFQASNCGIASLLGYNRTKLPCEEIYCHFDRPKKLLQFIGAPETISDVAVITLLICLVAFRFGAYLVIKHNLNKR